MPQDPLYNFDKWKNILIPTEQGWEKASGLDGLDGAVWFTTIFNIEKEWSGKDLVLSLGRVRDADVTFVNGKEVGETSGTGYRKYTIPAAQIHIGENRLLVQVLNFNDKGGLTSSAKELMIYPKGVDPSTIKGGITSSPMTLAVDTLGNVIKPIMLKGDWKYWIQNDSPPDFPCLPGIISTFRRPVFKLR